MKIKLIVKYSKNEDIDISNFINVKTMYLLYDCCWESKHVLVVGVIGVIYLQKRGHMNLTVKECYGQLN